MKNSTFAIGWVFSFFFFIAISYATHTSMTWIWGTLEDAYSLPEKKPTSFALESIALAISAAATITLTHLTLKLLKWKHPQHFRTIPTLTKLTLVWLLLFASYAVLLILTVLTIEEIWYRESFINRYRFLSSEMWDNVRNLLELTLPILANTGLIYLTLRLTSNTPANTRVE